MNYFIQLFIWHQEIIIDFIPHAISKSLSDDTFQEYFKAVTLSSSMWMTKLL